LHTHNSTRPHPHFSPLSSSKVIDIHFYPTPLLSPITFQSTPSSSISSQRYSTISIASSLPIPFYFHSFYEKVIRFMFCCYYLFDPFVSSSLYPSAFVGCWWDLRRDSSFYYLCIILVLGVFQGLCGVWIISTLPVGQLQHSLLFGADLSSHLCYSTITTSFRSCTSCHSDRGVDLFVVHGF
jgi:hypothetical protein